MIDTLARHLAALHEARRLVRMVLVNNPAFVAFEQMGATADGRVDAALACDGYYAAFCHLNDAIALLSPELGPVPTRADAALCERIVELKPAAPSQHQPDAAPASTRPKCGSPTGERALSSLSERVRYVLEQPPDDGPPPLVLDHPVGRDEAKVAIVWRDQATAAGTNARLATLAGDAPASRFRLFPR